MKFSFLKVIACAIATMLIATAIAQNAKPIKIADEFVVKVQPDSPYGKASASYVFEHVFSSPGASYIKLHLKKFDLAPGDYLEIVDASGAQSQIYAGKGKWVNNGEAILSDFWSGSIMGDEAKVRLWANSITNYGGFQIDRVAYGYPEAQIQAMMSKSICGSDDKEQIICHNGTERYTKGMAVCRIVINGSGLCTGWLLGSEGHVMTNNHCIGNAADAQNTDFQFNYENLDCGGSGPAITDQVASTSTLMCTSAMYDYTLVQLPVNPTTTYGYLSFRSTAPTIGERIYIPQHPGGRRKEIAVDNDQQASGFAEIVDNGNRVEYLCDTEGGSSGSPVIGWNDNLVVALHNTGGCENGGNRNNNIIADMGTCLPLDAVGSITVPPVTDFSTSVSCLTVDFTDLSTNFPNAWAWEFGDGNVSSMANPTHIYAGFGSYTVTLIATNSNGSDTLVMPNVVTIIADDAPTTDSLALCGANSAVLTAQGANLYDWYSDPAGSNFLGTGATYTTGNLTQDTTFYVGTNGDCASITFAPLHVSVLATAVPDSAFGAVGCAGSSFTFQAYGPGTLNWYGVATGGNVLGTGSSFNAGVLNTTQNFWVSSSLTASVTENVGPLDGSISTGGHQSFVNRLVFNALSDITIVSAWVDAGSAGDRDVNVIDGNGNLVVTTSVFIPAGQGRVTLNLQVPAGNDYELGFTGAGLIDLFRNNGGPLAYPFISDHVEITGSTAATPDGFYYYFYDWEVLTGENCEGPRLQVSGIVNPAPSVSVSLIGNTMDAGSGFATYQWYWNGSAISGATSQTYTAVNDGAYYCIITDANGCEGVSNTLSLTPQAISDQFAESGFAMWPNPVSNELSVFVGADAGNYELYTVSGARVLSGNFSKSFTLDVSAFAEGVYVMKIITTKGSFAQQLIVD